MISVSFSNLIILGKPQKFIFFPFLFIFVFLAFFLRSKDKHIRPNSNRLSTPLIIFLSIVFVTMIIRGFGLQIFGSEKINGFQYIQLALSAPLIFLLPRVDISAKQWYYVLVAMCMIGFLPLIAATGLRLEMIPEYIDIYSLIDLEQDAKYLKSDSNITDIRNFSARNAGNLFFVLALLKLKPAKFDVRTCIALLISLLITALSGHRGHIIILLFMLVTFFVLKGDYKNVLLFLLACSVILLMTPNLVQLLPYPIQRSLSWLPFIDVSEYSQYNAQDSIDWRVLIWQYGLKEVPKYWLVGKGLAYDPNSVPFFLPEHFAWAVRTTNYHNGPLSILITQGVAGFISIAAFVIIACKRHLQFLRQQWNSNLLKHFHLTIFSLLLAGIISFNVINGHIAVNLPKFFFLFAILEGLVATDCCSVKASYKLNIFKSGKLKALRLQVKERY